MSRYEVVDKSGKSYGTFSTKPLAFQFINNTFPSYKNTLNSDGRLRESTIGQVLPDIMTVVSINLSKPKPKIDWEKLIELTMTNAADTDEIIALREKLIKKSSSGEAGVGLIIQKTGISVMARTTDGSYGFYHTSKRGITTVSAVVRSVDV